LKIPLFKYVIRDSAVVEWENTGTDEITTLFEHCVREMKGLSW
jgi:dGTP triphosphohydrolase